MNEQSPLLNSDEAGREGQMTSNSPSVGSARSSPQQGPPVTSPAAAAPSPGAPRWVLLLTIIALMFAIGWVKFESDQRMDSMHSELLQMQLRLNALEASQLTTMASVNNSLSDLTGREQRLEAFSSKFTESLSAQNATWSSSFGSVTQHLAIHDKALLRLSNGTSNADVLDKLQETRAALHDEMAENLRNVSHILEGNVRQMNQTRKEVSVQLNNTIQAVRVVVGDATKHIHQVQANVTSQMDNMSKYLSSSLTDLSSAVDAARNTIKDEVETVQGQIEQYVLVTNERFATENDFVKYQVAGTFTLLSVLIFLFHLTSHARHYYKPDAQRRIMAVLWMVPVYGITSWLSLLSPSWEPTLGALRDLAEAYVIYTFVGLLVAVLADGRSFHQLIDKLADHVAEERAAVADWQRAQQMEHGPERDAAVAAFGGRCPQAHLVPPFTLSRWCCCLRSPPTDPRTTAKSWLWQCQLLAMQFVFVKPLTTFVPLLLAVSGVYDVSAVHPWHHHAINWGAPRLYIIAVQNISVALAFYGLLSFFHGAERDLEWCNPWPKFLCIKGVVFATFWQSLVLQGMSAYDLVDEKTAAQCQNLLICVEMLIASISHLYIFPHQEWAPDYQKARQRSLLLRDTMALGDFVRDMRRLASPWDPIKTHDGASSVSASPMKESQGLAPQEEQEALAIAEAGGQPANNPLLRELVGELRMRLDLLKDQETPPDGEDPNGRSV